MIIKTISHTQKNSAKLLIKYVFDKRKPLLDKDGKLLVFKSGGIRTYDKDKWSKQFKDLESKRTSKYANRSVVSYHEVISFSPASTKHLDRHKIKDLVNRYIKLRSNNQYCVGAVHFEKNKNFHAHLIFSGIQTTNNHRSARISKSRLASIKREVQEYQQQKYPELSDSIVRHGLSKQELARSHSEKEAQLKKRTQQPSEKDKLFLKVEQAFEKSRSQDAFRNALKQQGIQTYDHNGKLCGVFYGKRKFRLKRSLGIDPELLLLKDKFKDRSASLSQLRKQMEHNRSKGRER